MEKWFVSAKKADFRSIGAEFSIDPVIARLIVNRGAATVTEIRDYLYSGLERISPPALLKGCTEGAKMVQDAIRTSKKIRIIGDYDCGATRS